MIKATDLMIGDWIMYGDKPVQVLQLTADKIYKGFFPIPLTPEILEKNGFVFDKNRKAYLMGLIFQLHQRFDGSFYLNDVQCLSIGAVHELQHTLKLCGILKEIVI